MLEAFDEIERHMTGVQSKVDNVVSSNQNVYITAFKQAIKKMTDEMNQIK